MSWHSCNICAIFSSRYNSQVLQEQWQPTQKNRAEGIEIQPISERAEAGPGLLLQNGTCLRIYKAGPGP